MSLHDALMSGWPLLIQRTLHHGSLVEFLLGGFAEAGGRFAVAKLGWDDPESYSGHDFHLLPGKLDCAGPGPWKFDGGQIMKADEQHDLVLSYLYWRNAQGEAWISSMQKGCNACSTFLSEHPVSR